MRFVQFIYTKDWSYIQESYSDYTYQMLGIFLTDEVGTDSTSYKNWALDPNGGGGSGNIIYSDKIDGNIILSYDSFMDPTEEEIAAQGYKFLNVEKELTIPQNDFIHIVDEWIKLPRQGFDEIWIKNDNGIFWVERVK